MDMRLLQVHSIAFNSTRNAADEDHGSIRLHFLYDADMGEGIVCLPVAIEIPGVIKKHKVAWSDLRSAMQGPISAYMVINESNAVGIHIMSVCAVEIDTMFKEDGMGDSGTVVGDASSLASNCPRSDQSRCGLNDGRSARQRRRKGGWEVLQWQCSLRMGR